ncbi:MAG: hypothetical protein JW798_08360, partial [Prolixibacteraceae bacterium]|nr:hypothetical protein [Prolixibacteraceae bacterium]
GNVFYSYGFEYYELPVNTSGDGYDAFSEEEQWQSVSFNNFSSLNQNTNFSLNGSIYTGYSFPLFGIPLEFGVKGGGGFGWEHSDAGLIDFNGDGLNDYFEKNSNTMAYLNGGYKNKNFNSSPLFSNINLNAATLNQSDSVKLYAGASAKAGPAEVSAIISRTWTDSKNAFVDVDNDGLIDLLTVGKSTWMKNRGAGRYSEEPWNQSNNNTPPKQTAPLVLSADFKRNYYQQNPLKKWTAPRPGNITMHNQANLLYPDSNSRDGVNLEIWYDKQLHTDMPLAEMPLDSSKTSDEKDTSLEINKNDNLYFYLDPGEDERNDGVNWTTEIKYQDIELFGNMNETALFRPLTSSQGNLPYNEQRLLPIYITNETSYTLRGNWEDFANPSVYQALIEHSAFIPRAIDETIYQQINDSLNNNNDKILLANAFKYDYANKRFLRKNSQADGIIQGLLPQVSNTEQRLAMALYTIGNERKVALKNNGTRYQEEINYENPASRIYLENLQVEPGAYVYGHGNLIDRIYDEKGEEIASLWMNYINNEPQASIEPVRLLPKDFNITEVTETHVRVTLNNINIDYELSETDYFIQEMPVEFYEDVVHQKVMAAYEIGLYPINRLSLKDYNHGLEMANESQATVLKNSYNFDETANSYQLKPETTETSMAMIAGFFDRLYPANPGIFNDLGNNRKTIIQLREEEYRNLCAYFQEPELTKLQTSFMKITANNVISYISVNSDSWANHQLARYYRDAYLFPYYALEGRNRLLREIPDTEENQGIIEERKNTLIDFWKQAEIRNWKQARKSLVIGQGTRLKVEEIDLPLGQVVTNIVPGTENITPGSPVGMVTFPVLDETKRTVIFNQFIPCFNSEQDFSINDYNRISEIHQKAKEYEKPDIDDLIIDDFFGGTMGWYYNMWSGFHEFKPENIGKFNKKCNDKLNTEPNYTLGVKTKAQYDEEEINPAFDSINEIGQKDTTPMDNQTWIGSVSSYKKAVLNEEGQNVITEYIFAPYITANKMVPCRNGGNLCHETPQNTGGFAAGVLGNLNKSTSNGENYTANVNGIGNINLNTSRSWQYTGIGDYNGDRYPDLLVFDREGSKKGKFYAGTGKGFKDEEIIDITADRINLYNNLTIGTGFAAKMELAGLLSMPTGAIGLNLTTNAQGKVTASNIVQTNGSNGNKNGSLGQGILQKAIMDINGDGLPDALNRDSNGDIIVALNTGIGNTWAPAAWNNTMDETLADWQYQIDTTDMILKSRSHGLAYSNNGSLGSNMSFGIASVGYTANNNKTCYRLVDINNDGLLDQVGKNNHDKYFRVRFNLGDSFSKETIKLYKPEWKGLETITLTESVIKDLLALLAHVKGMGIGSITIDTIGKDNFNFTSDLAKIVTPFEIEDTLDYSSGGAFNLGANLNFSIPIGFGTLQIVPGTDGSVAVIAGALQFQDIDGDGLPDHIMKAPGETQLRVISNNMGKVGLLKDIKLPFGGDITLEYNREGNTTSMPQSRYVLAKVTNINPIESPNESVRSYAIEYEYQNGYYHKMERQFMGFGTVKTIAADKSYFTQEYENQDFYKQGQLVNQKQYKSNGSLISEIQYFYKPLKELVLNEAQSICYALSRTDTSIFDPEGENDIQTRTDYDYNETGSIREIIEYGAIDTFEDDYALNITYKPDLGGYRINYPEEMTVTDSNGRLLRKRSCEKYDARGNAETIRYYRTENEYLEY